MPSRKSIMLVIGHVWPEPGTTAAGLRMMQLLSLFQRIGFEITFASTASKTKYSTDLNRIGIAEQTVKLNDPQFDELLLQIEPELVLFDRFMTEEQFGWRVSETLPDCLRILNTEDLHSLRASREYCLKENLEFNLSNWLSSDLTKRELASIYRSDLSLMISSYELRFLQEQVSIPKRLLFYLPFIFNDDIPDNGSATPGFNERKGFIFVGNGKHSPNTDAISWLVNDIWPGIREKLPESSLHIYGAYLPDSIWMLQDEDEGIFVEGYTDELHLVMQRARVNLVPLRFGAGLKGKLFDAMINGTPSVATSIGWEGIRDDRSISQLSPKDAESFADASVALYSQELSWMENQKEDRELLRSNFGISDYQKKLKSEIQELSRHLSEHRSENVVGTLLMHHTMASTKYMSRWIEAKNRIQKEQTESS